MNWLLQMQQKFLWLCNLNLFLRPINEFHLFIKSLLNEILFLNQIKTNISNIINFFSLVRKRNCGLKNVTVDELHQKDF